MDLTDRIISARKNDEEKRHNKEIEQKKCLETCISKFYKLTSKIKKIIDVANTLIDNGYYDDFVKPRCSDGYRHLVGLMFNSNNNKVDSVGICNGGWCGDYDFHTTGEKTYMTEHYKSTPVKENIKITNAERTLRDFNDFEERFYDDLEEFLQNKGV